MASKGLDIGLYYIEHGYMSPCTNL